MKKIWLTLALMLFASPGFAATVIVVQCNCSFYEDYIQRNILAVGTRMNPTSDEVLECVIDNGKVVSGCAAAKWNARLNCQEFARRFSSGGEERVSAELHEEACFGQIRND